MNGENLQNDWTYGVLVNSAGIGADKSPETDRRSACFACPASVSSHRLRVQSFRERAKIEVSSEFSKEQIY